MNEKIIPEATPDILYRKDKREVYKVSKAAYDKAVEESTEEERLEAINDWFEVALDEALYGKEETDE